MKDFAVKASMSEMVSLEKERRQWEYKFSWQEAVGKKFA